jgi:4-alpha-glucanotransferase
MDRSSGVLMPLSSIPSNYGIGTMGKCSYKFIDFLRDSGQKYWQLLPLGPTSYGDSPYSSFSSYAGNPYYIDFDLLVKDGLLKRYDFRDIDWGSDPARVDYGKIYKNRFKVLRKAFKRGREALAEECLNFRKENLWADNYALYMAVKAKFGMKSWTQWPEEDIRLHRPEAVEKYSRLLKEDMDFYIFIQYLFFRQWNELKEYAHESGIKFIGDIPIYVALDSADVWSEPGFFLLDENNLPRVVAGCPPDGFTPDGQLWGNPIYDWEKMKNDGYGWWIRRVDGARRLFDVVRIDHFRGLESYWSVPCGDSTAVNGKWNPGPGMGLAGVLSSWFRDMKFIAEDLGYMTPEVKKLVQDSGFPGMRVLQFAFDAHSESDYLPHRCEYNSVCYVGTHDNDTVRGWLKTTGREDRQFARKYMHITEDEGWCWGFIRTGMATASKLFVMQMQDILELPADCRMNTPGSPYGNWQWRMLPDAIDKKLTKKLLDYTRTYRRTEI